MENDNHEAEKKAAFTFVRVPLVILAGLVLLGIIYFVVIR